MSWKFEIPDHKIPELEAWLKEQNEQAKKDMESRLDESDAGFPPSATGEYVMFMFMPTSLGPVIKVRHLWTKNEIDLSDEI
jgi:hypothetical protein